MKNIVRLTFAVAAIALFACNASDVNAQNYDGGYRFGLGFNQGTRFNASQGAQFGASGFGRRGGGFGFGGVFNGGLVERSVGLPYFAQFPPVYYSGIIKRPYGISPFATPPGILPTELQVAIPKSVTISNPFFDNEVIEDTVESIQVEVESKPAAKPLIQNQTTQWVPNPYTEWQVSN